MSAMICRVAIAGLALLGFSANLLAEPQDDYFKKLFVLDSKGFPRGMGSITLDSSFSGGDGWTPVEDKDAEQKSYVYKYENGDSFSVSVESSTGEVSYMSYLIHPSYVEFNKNLNQYLYDNFRKFDYEKTESENSVRLTFWHGPYTFSVYFADTLVIISVSVDVDWYYYY